MKDIDVIYTLPADTSLQRILGQSADYRSLSANDQQVTYYLNYARLNPKVFLEKAINVFAAAHPELKSSYSNSLQQTFKSLSPLNVIMPSSSISAVSMAHATDLRTHNMISHNSSDGRTFQQRLGSVVVRCGGESIHSTQRYNPLEAVLQLLFDFNVPDLGHRKSLLSTTYTKAGFGSSVVKNGFSVLVIDFSCQ